MADGCEFLSKGNKICSGFENKDFDLDLWVTNSALSLYPFLFRFYLSFMSVYVCVYVQVYIHVPMEGRSTSIPGVGVTGCYE